METVEEDGEGLQLKTFVLQDRRKCKDSSESFTVVGLAQDPRLCPR